MKTQLRSWAPCRCGCAPEDHMPVVVKPICVDPGNRVLFEGTLGACIYGDCDLYDHASDRPTGTPKETQP